MSPAFKNNNNFVKAAAKMPAVGIETKWPRKDNAFMAKQSLSFQEALSKVWQERDVGDREVYIEWGCYVVVGILIGVTALIMDLIEESLVHFKDHMT
jgi:hypothetical protein